MSKAIELRPNLSNLPELIIQYEDELVNVLTHLEVKGKSLKHANMEQASHEYFYSYRLSELKSILKMADINVARARGKLFKQYTEHHSIDLSDRAKEQYINNDDAYISAFQLYLEVKETYDKYEAALEAFRSRGYALNNITKARIAEVESDII